ncbi:UDP-diphosphatase [Leptospira perolatii]|uniref:Undecaprenyl-diphosphatase n=1 Tax=Leptospira perolatii TaxID=2023191 RepID=A0A2M9ZR33_9LEPT|nr:undecaprenyl-diphosphate phosphatase [Leptospira perolatii]PJZ70557.1 UDP-diphosphatase [Leptospira perolatii]PJZ74393.1 UDP-diphosphatase [Leptospira perolatii]
MDSFLNALIRSVIEAITEFLPVSSTGHLFLFSSFFPFSGQGTGAEFDDLFDIFIQSGAILSVLVLYHQRFTNQIRFGVRYLLKKEKNPEGILFISQILIGCIPILLAGFLLKDKLDTIKARNDLLLILGSAWVVGGILILGSEAWFRRSSQKKPPESVHLKDSILIGIFQCFALIPGVSRSAATIVTARFLGKDAKHAAEFSFFLAVPVLLSAGAYKLYKYRNILNAENLPVLAFGFLASFLLCILVIRLFIKYVQSHTFDVFGVYRILLGLCVIAFYKLN